MADRLSVSLQENLLVLLCFDPEAAPVIRNTVELLLFGNRFYREIIGAIYDYLDKYRMPPGDHLPDLLEPQLAADGADSAMYSNILTAVDEQRDKVNRVYVLSQLEHFVRGQTLKGSVANAAEAIQEGDLDRAEAALHAGLKTRITSFNEGLRLARAASAVYTKQVRLDIIPVGIRELDAHELGPARGEFHLFIGPPKVGKTWWLVHMAKRGLLHRKKVSYITLELSEGQIGQRLIQALFSMTRRKARVPVTRLRGDTLGRLLRLDQDTLTGRLSLDDSSSRAVVEKKIARIHGNENLVIKQFPAGALTVRALRSYLDMMEQSCGFVPDMVVIDYPDYMKIDPRNYRFEIGALYNDLRGLAVERNVSVVVAKRSNRDGAKARLVTETHSAEDFSAIYTADTILTYSRTLEETRLGLARLFVSSSRVTDRDRFIVLMSQAYPVGQFCLDSAMLSEQYWGFVEQAVAALPPEQVQTDDHGVDA